MTRLATPEARTTPLFQKTAEIILRTDYKERSEEPLFRRFRTLDTQVLASTSPAVLLPYEHGVYREYQRHSWAEYRRHRCAFLKGWMEQYPEHAPACRFLIDYVQSRRPSIGIYAGSFNPFHRGHLDILRQAEAAYDKVIIAVGVNPKKTSENQVSYDTTRSLLRFHDVRYFTGLLTDLLTEEEEQGQQVTLIRGIRQDTDLRPERIQIYAMQGLKPDLKTHIVLCHHEHEIVSSSLVRELRQLGASTTQYVPTQEKVYGLAAPLDTEGKIG